MLSEYNFKKSFGDGFFSVMNLGPKIELPCRLQSAANPAEADFIALQGDWIKIGQDINQAMDKYEHSSE